jgi:hypothetical protein
MGRSNLRSAASIENAQGQSQGPAAGLSIAAATASAISFAAIVTRRAMGKVSQNLFHAE